MKIFITGGSGFVGTALSRSLLSRGHEVTAANRSIEGVLAVDDRIRLIKADTTVRGMWQDELGRHDAVVNLAGASVFQRWTKRIKNEILRSRVDTTRNIVEAIGKSGRKIDLFSTSAVGYYGFRGDEEIDETTGAGADFLARVCVAWEDEAARAGAYGSRVTLCRFGVVLGKNGGALEQLASQFKRYMGGVLGSGEQWFSWIHMEDLIGMFHFLLENTDVSGPVNFTSPQPVTNRELTGALSRAVNKPVILPPAPGFALRILLGEFGDFLLRGQRVIPAKIMKRGYGFRYPDIRSALKELLP